LAEYAARHTDKNPRIHQLEIREYVDKNLRSMNVIRRLSQSDYQISVNQAFESYVSSLSKIIYEKELSMLNKLYKKKKKFENTENNFDFKLTIYLDKCRHADLSEHAYEKGIFVMLTDEALIRY
jgi:Leu/Phe-tRNA-protein transferase